MKTTVGSNAEAAVAVHLKQDGYKILQRNWRTRLCEIDIVAKAGEVVYFIEVKYRGSDSQGSGFEYIGPQKLRQLEFAAKMWASFNSWDGDYRIIGAEVSGADFQAIELVEIY